MYSNSYPFFLGHQVLFFLVTVQPEKQIFKTIKKHFSLALGRKQPLVDFELNNKLSLGYKVWKYDFTSICSDKENVQYGLIRTWHFMKFGQTLRDFNQIMFIVYHFNFAGCILNLAIFNQRSKCFNTFCLAITSGSLSI